MAKLLDFGLAKLKPTGPQSDASTKLADSLTQQGTILGTFQYMAPEQLEAGEADARTDIWAFGCVVYEMVMEKKAFEGKSQANLIAAILDRDPPLMAEAAGATRQARPAVPPMLEHIVRRCLAKDPDGRWQTAGDLKHELKWAVEVAGRVSESPAPTTHRRGLGSLALGAVTLLLGAGLATAAWYLAGRDAAPPGAVTRSVIPLSPAESLMLNRPDQSGASLPFLETTGPSVTISGDGTRLVYLGYEGGRSRLYLRGLDEFEAQPLPGTEGAIGAFFSPDGQWVAYFAQGQLKKIAVSGGTPVTLSPVANPRGGTWGPDGTIIFAPGFLTGLSAVSAEGGAARALTTIDAERGERTHRFPEVLPDGKAVIFTVGGRDDLTFDDARIEVLSLTTGERKVLVNGAASARYVPTGHLILHAGRNALRGGLRCIAAGACDAAGRGPHRRDDVARSGACRNRGLSSWIIDLCARRPTGAPQLAGVGNARRSRRICDAGRSSFEKPTPVARRPADRRSHHGGGSSTLDTGDRARDAHPAALLRGRRVFRMDT